MLYHHHRTGSNQILYIVFGKKSGQNSTSVSMSSFVTYCNCLNQRYVKQDESPIMSPMNRKCIAFSLKFSVPKYLDKFVHSQTIFASHTPSNQAVELSHLPITPHPAQGVQGTHLQLLGEPPLHLHPDQQSGNELLLSLKE